MAVITDDNDGNIIFEGPGAVSSVASWHATIVSRSQCPEKFAFFGIVLAELGLKCWVELGIQGLAVRCFTGSDKESDGGGGCGLLDVLGLTPGSLVLEQKSKRSVEPAQWSATYQSLLGAGLMRER